MSTDIEIIERMKREILADIEAGTVPATVRTFSALHDYVDANCYGGFCDEDPDAPEWDELVKQANRCQTSVDKWLRNGRREVPWITLGEFKAATHHLPDETPITADGQGLDNGSMWYNVELDPSGIPTGAGDDPPSIILGLVDNFDTRQW